MTKITAADLENAKANNTSNVMYNTAYAKAGEIEDSKKEQVSFLNTLIEKKGNLNSSGLIDWTVTIKAPHNYNGGFLKDYVLTDKILQGDVRIVGSIAIRSNNGKTDTITQDEFNKGYKLSKVDDNAYEYTVTYQTTAPASGGTVKNQAKITREDGKKKIDFTANASVDVQVGKWGLTKTHNRTENDIAYWNLSAVNVAGADHFDLTDTIGNTTDSSGTVLQNKHYAIASELQNAIKKGLTLTLTDNRTLNYQQAKDYLTITYLDASNNKVEANDNNTPVLSFTIAVKKAENGTSIAVRQMVLNDVPTHEVRSDKPGNADWTFTNNAKITQGGNIKASDSAEDVYRSSVFEKSVPIDGKRDEYITGDTTVNYDDVKDQKLLYRIRLVTTGTETGEILIKDALPTGTELTVNGDKIRLYVDNERYGWYESSRWSLDRYNKQTNMLVVHVYGCNDGKQHVIELWYEVSFKNDSRWKDLLTSDISYTNKAEWGDKSAAIKTTVHKDIAPLIKTGEQLKDKNGNWTNNVTYKVIINPVGSRKLGTTGTLKLQG